MPWTVLDDRVRVVNGKGAPIDDDPMNDEPWDMSMMNERIMLSQGLLRQKSRTGDQAEFEILRELQKEESERTTIIVSHRISTIRNARHIIVIDDGSVIEEGSHADLLKRKGFYYGLYKKQQSDLKDDFSDDGSFKMNN